MEIPNIPKYQRYFCSQPFSTASVNANGEVFLCCAAFLNDSAGNILQQPFGEVWNSEKAQDLRRTILDGTYSHCVEARCPFLQGEVLLQTKEEITDPVYRDIIEHGTTELATGPREFHAAYDSTCNLACPYCRSDYIALKGEELAQSQRIHEAVVQGALGISNTLVVSSQGDPFASKLYSKILREFDAARFPNLRIRITTNGMLLTPENWESIRAAHAALEHIHVSVNGASKESFEANQRGASWEQLLENLRFISKHARRNGDQDRFVTLSFIVQKNNYREMPAFVRLVQELGFNRAHFGQIFHADRTYSDAEFAKLPVHWPHHPEHQEFQRVLSDPILGEPEAYFIGGMAVYLPRLRRYLGITQGETVSGAEFLTAEGVDWFGWAEALGLDTMEGVSTPKLVRFSGMRDSAQPRLRLEDLRGLLALDDDHFELVSRTLHEMQDALVALFEAPAATGDTAPLEAAAADIRSGAIAGIPAAIEALFAYAAQAKPLGARATYYDRFSRIELDFRERLYQCMPPRQRKAYLALPIGGLLDIDLGREPLVDSLRGAILRGPGLLRERMSWHEFSASLGLDAAAEAAVKAELVAFKERVAGVMGETPRGGGESPLAAIAESLRLGQHDAARGDIDQLMRTGRCDDTGQTYAERIGALDAAARAALAQRLSPEHRYRLDWLPVPSLLAIETPGADPIGAAVAACMRGANARPTAAAR